MTGFPTSPARLLTARRGLTMVGLIAGWCALWGSFSVANLLSGFAVTLISLAVGVGGSGRGAVRIVPLSKLVWLVVVDLVVSTATIVLEVLTPTDSTAEAIIAVRTPAGCRHHLALLYAAVTVTPGTAVVAAESDGSLLYLHVLHGDRRDSVEAHVQRLAGLAIEALPEPSPISAVSS